MKNVTITLDEEAARWARIQAAEHNTSVSRLVGEMLLKKAIRWPWTITYRSPFCDQQTLRA
jgi:hypothetical protein